MSDEIISENPKPGAAVRIDFDLVSALVRMLEPLPREDQKHVIQTVTTWLKLPASEANSVHRGSRNADPAETLGQEEYRFAERSEASPKEFLLEKDPHTDVERMAVLAYYLTHFRSQPQFRTEELSKLNTEAAHRKFSNAAFTASNAVRDGFFVPAAKAGMRQLSALGEQYVQALPDHDAARALRKRMSSRRQRPLSANRRGEGIAADRAAV